MATMLVGVCNCAHVALGSRAHDVHTTPDIGSEKYSLKKFIMSISSQALEGALEP